MKKLLTIFMMMLILFSSSASSYAEEKNNKIYLVVTGFTHIWGFAENDATDSFVGDMPFTKANYDIKTPGKIYDFDKKLVTAGFGSTFKDGNKALDLKPIQDRFNIKEVKVYPYDLNNADISGDKWTSDGADFANKKTVQFNTTSRAGNKFSYDDQYLRRSTSVSGVTSNYDKASAKLSYSYSNTIPSFSSLGADLDEFKSKSVRLDAEARRGYDFASQTMTDFSGAGWEASYGEVSARIKEAAQNTPSAKKLRGYMFFTPIIIEITVDLPVELAMADTLYQVAPGTSFKDGSGATRDKLDIFDKNGKILLGNTVIPGEKYKMCSYVLNKGMTDTTVPIVADFYMVDHDLNRFPMPVSEKISLGNSEAEQFDVRAFLPKDRMGTYCK